MLKKLILILLLVSTSVGCSVTVQQRDDESIAHWADITEVYQGDLVRAAGLPEETTLTSADFPVGDLTWSEFSSTLDLMEAYRVYEDLKQDAPEEE